MAETRVAKEALEAERMGDYEGRNGTLGEYNVAFESIPAGFPPGGAEAFKGLPDDACQCPHWGYLFKGSFRVRYTDGHVETVREGDAYYLAPGHLFEAVEDCETVEFSPSGEWEKTVEVVGRNIEELTREMAPGRE